MTGGHHARRWHASRLPRVADILKAYRLESSVSEKLSGTMPRPSVLVPVKVYVSTIIRLPVKELVPVLCAFNLPKSYSPRVHVELEDNAHPKQAWTLS